MFGTHLEYKLIMIVEELSDKYLEIIICVVFSSKEKSEFRISLLLGLCHLLELRTVPCHKLGQFVDDVFRLWVIRRPGQLHDFL